MGVIQLICLFRRNRNGGLGTRVWHACHGYRSVVHPLYRVVWRGQTLDLSLGSSMRGNTNCAGYRTHLHLLFDLCLYWLLSRACSVSSLFSRSFEGQQKNIQYAGSHVLYLLSER